VPNGTVYARTRSVTVCFEPRSGSKVSIELSIRRGLMACFDDGEIVGPLAERDATSKQAQEEVLNAEEGVLAL
jgi:hypothetical protein